MKSHFLRAEWNHLVLANYVVPSALLQPYVPFKTELSFFKGEAYVSLVGFMFLNTKVLGLRIPMHMNFEEVNLRFYIRYNDQGYWKQGVVFIKEIVPKIAISFVANTIYREKYATMEMRHFHKNVNENFQVGYEWKFNNKWNHLSALTDKSSHMIQPDSEESYFADHYWGYSKYNHQKTYEYEVAHEKWETMNVISHQVDCDFGALYGNEFAFLQHQKPASVMMTPGSEIKVFHKKTL